jgi:hypothetical protein
MGDVVGFKGKKGKKTAEAQEDVTIVACGNCEQPVFYLSVDGRVFCEVCLYPVAALWVQTDEQLNPNPPDPAA